MFRKIVLLVLFVFAVTWMTACEEKYPVETKKFASVDETSCVSCHTDKDLLIKVADPLPDTGGESGEG
ncbi:MAG: hypothetical protein AB7W47_11470 [Calditrichaceae bacterium]